MTTENKIRTHVATYPDGSQTLVEVFPDGHVTIAARPDRWATWGPPVRCEDMTWTG